MSSKQSRSDSFASNKKLKICLECKLNISNDSDAKLKSCDLTKKFYPPESTVRTITKGKETILDPGKMLQYLNSTIISKGHGIFTRIKPL